MKPVTKAILLAVLSVMGFMISCRLSAQSGTFVPTSPFATNCTVSAIDTAQWMQVGNEIIVYGNITTKNYTVPGQTTVEITQPWVSNLRNSFNATGSLSVNEGTGIIPGTVFVLPNGIVALHYVTTKTGQASVYYHYMYILQ